ncbi:hypothetical protein R5R35_013943 [Gryllus longicercus]|uniref:Uncharacterized protein n=1 Tax=Gryllus longicercus TaxID=2509291 RepID=A0AAN9YY23_9ORTH
MSLCKRILTFSLPRTQPAFLSPSPPRQAPMAVIPHVAAPPPLPSALDPRPFLLIPGRSKPTPRLRPAVPPLTAVSLHRRIVISVLPLTQLRRRRLRGHALVRRSRDRLRIVHPSRPFASCRPLGPRSASTHPIPPRLASPHHTLHLTLPYTTAPTSPPSPQYTSQLPRSVPDLAPHV